MKKYILILLSFLFLTYCSSSYLISTSHEYFVDLASENNRIAAKMSRQVFNGDLESLTYSYYIKYLEENVTPSAKEIVELIKDADCKYFESKRDAFIIALFYNSTNTFICDISNNGFIDSVYTYSEDEIVPALNEIVAKISF